MQSVPQTTITAQEVLQGKYDLDWMIIKARHDLSRAMTVVPSFHYAAMDFAVSIASMADWAYMVHLRHTGDWASVTPRAGVADFTKQIATLNVAVATFADLSNEFKHADRTRGSQVLAKLSVGMFASDAEALNDPVWLSNSIHQRSTRGMVLVPTIFTTSGSHYFFKPLAEAALNWWEAFDPTKFSPTACNVV